MVRELALGLEDEPDLSVIVAVDRIREIQPLANGDSTLILQDGHTIRASRSYRDTVRKRWAEFHGLPKDLPRTSP